MIEIFRVVKHHWFQLVNQGFSARSNSQRPWPSSAAVLLTDPGRSLRAQQASERRRVLPSFRKCKNLSRRNKRRASPLNQRERERFKKQFRTWSTRVSAPSFRGAKRNGTSGPVFSKRMGLKAPSVPLLANCIVRESPGHLAVPPHGLPMAH